MLMDEPFGAVDPIVRERLQNEFLRLQADLAKTILFVTHDIDEAIKMGDLVAVMQVGGQLAQFGSPEEILSNPASDFVARFVGADRGLKRLALSQVDDLELRAAPTVRVGEDAARARARLGSEPFGFVLLVDEAHRPLGWLGPRDLPNDGSLAERHAGSTSPLLDRRTTLKDALGMLIDAEVQAGVVVDPQGRVAGVLTADDIIEAARREAAAR
jgi:osmoprotectant transport system ATP-binding protein